MKNEDIPYVKVIVISLVFGTTFGVLVTSKIWEHSAIKRDYGQYCPTTGEWAWKGECND